MTRYSVTLKTQYRIGSAQEPTDLTPDQQDKVDLQAAAAMIRTGGESNNEELAGKGWSLLIKVYMRRFGELKLTTQDAMLLAERRNQFVEQIKSHGIE